MVRRLTLLLALASALFAQRTGSQVCGKCHGEILARYQKTAMGRSMARASTVRVERKETVGPYEVFEKGSELFQNSYRLDVVIGSGVNGQTFLARRGNAFVEAPLTFYTKARKWDLSPGYEKADFGFTRTLPEACLACHSSTSQLTPATRPEDLPVGCENCHGAGSAHALHPARGNIVNPARLDKRLADDICMYCHQGGDTRILQPGKTYSDFKPGTPLNQTIAIFKLPAKNSSDLLEHHSAMRLSRCYRESEGRMNCLTCHDPHSSVNYNARCEGCHAAKIHAVRVGGDCVSCHMPKRSVTQVAHAALTNHRIVIREGEPLPPDNSSIYFNGQMDALPDLTKLAAYGELGLRKEYLETLDALAVKTPDEPLVRASLGRRALLEKRYPEAAGFLKDASTVISLLDLAQALKLSGRQLESIPVLERAASLEPLNMVARKTLVLAYIEAKDYAKAKKSMRNYVVDFPEDTFMRQLLEKVSSR